MATEITEKWSPNHLAYIRFLAANKTDMEGNRYTRAEFATLIGVHERTVYDWQKLPGFKEAVFEESLGRRVDYLPQLIEAQIKKGKSGDTPAFLALMRQWELLKADRVDTKTELSGGVSFGNQVPIEQ